LLVQILGKPKWENFNEDFREIKLFLRLIKLGKILDEFGENNVKENKVVIELAC